MPSISFTSQLQTSTEVFATSVDVFTNCRQVSISRKLCDENWLSNYAAITPSKPQTLPAGEYRFTASMAGCSGNGCWMCVIPVDEGVTSEIVCVKPIAGYPFISKAIASYSGSNGLLGLIDFNGADLLSTHTITDCCGE